MLSNAAMERQGKVYDNYTFRKRIFKSFNHAISMYFYSAVVFYQNKCCVHIAYRHLNSNALALLHSNNLDSSVLPGFKLFRFNQYLSFLNIYSIYISIFTRFILKSIGGIYKDEAKYTSRLFGRSLESVLKSRGAVIQFEDGSWALAEVKLGDQANIDPAAEKLIDIANDIDEEKTGDCAFLMVITKGNLAYKRDDGVYIVPLGVLKN